MKQKLKKIETIDLIRTTRNPIPLKPTRVMKSKKVYDRKRKDWKKEID